MGFGSRFNQGSREEQDYQILQSMLQQGFLDGQRLGISHVKDGLPFLMSGSGIPGFGAGIDGLAGFGQPGFRGSNGSPGGRGPSGTPGADGADGSDGEMGDTGEKGEKGDKGDKGDRGDQGLPGPPGPEPTPSFDLQVVTDISYNSSTGELKMRKADIKTFLEYSDPTSSVSNQGTEYTITTAQNCP